MLPRIITKLAAWAISVFYTVERTGPRLTEGPVLVTANHPNALVDPLVIFRTAGRATRPLAKAPLFEHPLIGTVLKGLGGLPVYRRQDAPEQMHQNERTFDAAIASLHRAEAVQIYPEGQSHSEPALTPLRTGAARISLLAEERADWLLGLHVQPVGLTYLRKHLFRGHVVASFGPAIPVAEFRELHEKDPRQAVRDLTESIRTSLEALTLNLEEQGDHDLVDVAERLYAREKGLVGWRERASMADRLPRLQGFAGALRWLRTHDPVQHAELAASVRTYLRLITLFGAHDGDVPPKYTVGTVVRYSLRQGLLLLMVLPAAILGSVVWAVPYVVTHYVAPRLLSELDQIATAKLGTAILAFPSWFALLLVGTFLKLGLPLTLVFGVVAPIVGLASIAWWDRGHRVSEDAMVFFRVLMSPRGRDRLRSVRASLLADFRAVAQAMEGDRGEMPQ
jgi:1-acyl-sn-glycerol-3-phosphate acyltransferase